MDAMSPSSGTRPKCCGGVGGPRAGSARHARPGQLVSASQLSTGSRQALTTGIDLAETVSWRGLYVIFEHTPLRLEPDLHAVTRYNWGFVAPNDDVPVTATLHEVATAFLADYHDPDVLVPIEGLPRWGYNSVPQEFANFPWVAIHDPGDKEEYSGFDWTTWVVFLELDGHNVPRVVGLQKQEWGP